MAQEELERIRHIACHAIVVFGDEEKALHWLATVLPLLGNRSPAEVLDQQDGRNLVDQILTRIEHNIPS